MQPNKALNVQTTVREPFLPSMESERWPNIPAPEKFKQTISSGCQLLFWLVVIKFLLDHACCLLITIFKLQSCSIIFANWHHFSHFKGTHFLHHYTRHANFHKQDKLVKEKKVERQCIWYLQILTNGTRNLIPSIFFALIISIKRPLAEDLEKCQKISFVQTMVEGSRHPVPSHLPFFFFFF